MIKAVFIPGLDGSGLLFKPLAQRWPKDGSPPVALSYPPDRYLDYKALADYILPRLPRNEPYLLIAESFGGPLAVHIATQKPAGLRGLVLSATFVRQPRGWLGSLGKFLIGPYMFRGLLRTFGTWTMRLQGMARWQIDLLIKALAYTDPRVLAARTREAVEVDALPELKHCPVPVLCFYAKRDLILAKRCAELIGKEAPHVRLVGLDTPHYLLQVEPDEALEPIKKFADSLPISA
jgi:pimeloyl-[acyl-carrier protein] methyl ester esterase